MGSVFKEVSVFEEGSPLLHLITLVQSNGRAATSG